jgi:hypothetical protein
MVDVSACTSGSAGRCVFKPVLTSLCPLSLKANLLTAVGWRYSRGGGLQYLIDSHAGCGNLIASTVRSFLATRAPQL